MVFSSIFYDGSGNKVEKRWFIAFGQDTVTHLASSSFQNSCCPTRGGNYWMAGGAIKGKQIMGSYPASLLPDDDQILGRGRVIPSTPWDSVFNAIGEWVGITSVTDLDRVLPNRQKFQTLWSQTDFFN
jgi:hypothetical protein